MADKVQNMVTPIAIYAIHLIPLTKWGITEWRKLEKVMIPGPKWWFTESRRQGLRTVLELQSLEALIGKRLRGMGNRLIEERLDSGKKGHHDVTQMKVPMSILHSPHYTSQAEILRGWIVQEKKIKRNIPMTKRVVAVLKLPDKEVQVSIVGF